MRTALWIALLLVLLAAVIVPVGYLLVAAGLPRMDSELDLLALLKSRIEGERTAIRQGQVVKSLAVPFERPQLETYPKDLVAIYLSQRGCPTFFQTPREVGAPWAKRMIRGLVGSEPGGDGWCEHLFAERLAQRLGLDGKVQLAVASNKLHGFMTKDALVAYDLASMWFEEGIVGAEVAAQRLFGRKIDQLELSELAELALAMPPNGFWEAMRDCHNPPLMKQTRDRIIEQLSNDSLVAPERAKAAQQRVVSCTRR